MTMRYTTDYDEVRGWIIEHGGIPGALRGVIEEEKELPDMLHISFDANDPNIEPIEWNEFFERFENEGLALVYDDAPPLGEALEFELMDRDEARAEYGTSETAGEIDSGEVEVLRENEFTTTDEVPEAGL